MCTHVCARPRFLFHGKGSFLDEISRLSTAYPAQDSILPHTGDEITSFSSHHVKAPHCIIWREKSGERSRRTHFMGPAGCKGMLKTLANSYKTPSDTENKTKKNITQTLQTLCIFLQNFAFKTQGNSCWFVLSLVTTSHRNSKWSGTLISHAK